MRDVFDHKLPMTVVEGIVYSCECTVWRLYGTYASTCRYCHMAIGSLVPRPFPAFQCCTLKNVEKIEEPGDEAKCIYVCTDVWDNTRC